MLGLGKKKQPVQPAQPAGVNTPPQLGQSAQSKTAPTQIKKGAAPVNPVNNSMTKLAQGSVSLVDLIAPSAVEVDFKHVRVGNKYYRTFFVVDYPREVSPSWLSMLTDYKETMNVSMYIYPVESKDILSNLRRKIAEMEATIDQEAKQGQDADPKIQAALEDAIALREELARGLERFFQFGLYITIAGDTPEELNEKSTQLSTLLASNMLIVKPATLQMEEGYKTTLPYAQDKLYITRNMDTTSVASTFPFTSYEISHPNGILFGVNTLNNSLVILDRFSLENANEVVFGKSGSGKSFTVKLEILRQMMFDAEILIIDPEDEYRTLCHALDGEYINFSKTSEVKLNPFALLSDDTSEAQLGIKILSLHGLLKTMMGDMTPTQEAILDRSLVLVYKQKGITPDPATYKNEPPLLEDLYKTLLNMEEADAKDLAFRLEKYVKGGFSGLFNEQTNYEVRNQLTVFSIKQLEDALRPIAMHVILDFIWGRVRTKLKKRLLVVDEAWYMMKYPDSASFLQGIAKRARKYYLGVTTLTQDIEDFLNNDFGKAIVSNSSIQVLLKQNTAEVEALAKAFNLSDGEKQYLLTAQVGEGLLFAGQNHVSAQFIASQFEYDLITSKPQDVLQQEEDAPPPVPSTPSTPEPENNDEVTSTILDDSDAQQKPSEPTPAEPSPETPTLPSTEIPIPTPTSPVTTTDTGINPAPDLQSNNGTITQPQTMVPTNNVPPIGVTEPSSPTPSVQSADALSPTPAPSTVSQPENPISQTPTVPPSGMTNDVATTQFQQPTPTIATPSEPGEPQVTNNTFQTPSDPTLQPSADTINSLPQQPLSANNTSVDTNTPTQSPASQPSSPLPPPPPPPSASNVGSSTSTNTPPGTPTVSSGLQHGSDK